MRKILVFSVILFALFNTACATKSSKWDNLFDSKEWHSINTEKSNGE